MFKKIAYSVLLILLLFVPVYLVFFIYPKKVYKINTSDYFVCEDLPFEIENIAFENDVFCIEGWIVRRGESQKYTRYNKYVWFMDVQTEQIYSIRLNPSDQKRRDITRYFDDGTDYRESGFSLKTTLDELEFKKEYKIYLCYQTEGNNLLSDTKYVIRNKTVEKER